MTLLVSANVVTATLFCPDMKKNKETKMTVTSLSLPSQNEFSVGVSQDYQLLIRLDKLKPQES